MNKQQPVRDKFLFTADCFNFIAKTDVNQGPHMLTRLLLQAYVYFRLRQKGSKLSSFGFVMVIFQQSRNDL